MGTVLLLTRSMQPSADVLPGLALLTHQVRVLPAEGSALLEAPDHDVLLVDGRRELAQSRDLCRLIRTTGSQQPVILIVTEGGLAVVAEDWGADDVVLDSAGPAEIDARIRLAIGRLAARAASPVTDLDIDDPIGQDPAVFEAVGEVIADCLQPLFEAWYRAR